MQAPLLLFLLSCLYCPCAALKLPKIVTSNMVLAAERPTVFGWASHPAARVTATTSDTGETVSVTATGPEAYFKIELKPRPASMAPFNITLTEGGQSLLLSNLLAGDVWLCSGQSNMEFSVAEMFGADDIIKSAEHAGLRLFAVQKNASTTELQDISESQYADGWVEASPRTVCGAEYGSQGDYCKPHCGPSASVKSFARPTWGYFSAVCFAHGLELLRATGRPQGLLESCWGGTAIERWSSQAALAQCGGASDFEDEPEPSIGASEGNLWAGMVAPLLAIPVRGVVWYQGEANSKSTSANKYKCKLQALINDWRAKFAVVARNLTWVTVQLAAAGDRSGGALRLAQQAATALPGVGLAIATDLYDKKSPCGAVHIRNKTAVAERVALASLNLAYNQSNVHWTGPLPSIFAYGSDTAQIDFAVVDRPLRFAAVPGQTQASALQGFEVTADISLLKGWAPVPAKLQQSQYESIVVLNTTKLSGTLAGIRYSWGFTAFGEFLYDARGLPAGPFLARCENAYGTCALVLGGNVPLAVNDDGGIMI